MKRVSKTAKRMAMLSMAFCICSSIGWDSPQTRNDNSVTSLNYSQESARTLIEIGVQSDPTFSVYTLKNPERVVVEILDCDSSTRLSPIQVRNGIIDTAAISVSQANNYSTCRVILGLEKEATYAVDSTKDRIIVAVDGKPGMNASEMANAYESMKQSQEEALASARSMVEKEQAEARRARAEAEKAISDAENARAEAAAARNEAQASARSIVEREQAEARRARAEAEKAISDAEMAKAEAVAARNEAQASARSIVEREQAEARRARAEAEKAISDAEMAKAEAAAARNEAQASARSMIEKEQAEARRARAEAEMAISQAQLAADNARAEAAAARNEARASAEREKAALAQLERAYNEARERVSAIEAQRDNARMQAKDSETMSAALESAQAELAKAQADMIALEMARNQAIERAQNAENQRDLAQAQARESLQREQNAIAQLQQEQKNAAENAIRMAQLNAKIQQSQSEKDALIADLNEKTNQAQMLSERAERAQKEAQRLVEETKQNELTRIAEADNRVAAAETRVAKALQKAQDAQNSQNSQQIAYAQELNDAKSALTRTQRERDEAMRSAQAAESKAQNALETAMEQRRTADAQLAQLNAQLAEANSKVARLENENRSAQQNNATLVAENAELLQKIARQESQMAELNEAVKAGGAARQKLKQLEAQSEKTAEQEALIAQLKEQARQGRHAREQLNTLKAENEQLRSQIGSAKAATTAGSAADPAYAYVATTVPPIDATIGSGAGQKRSAAAPIDNQAAAHASVRDIQFRHNANGDGMQVILKMSAPVEKVENVDAGSQKSVLRIAGAVLPDNFNKKYDTSAFNQGVRFVDSTQASGGIELIAQASSKTIDSIEQNGDTITWNIRPLRDAASPFAAPIDRRNEAMVTAAEPNLPSPANYGAARSLKNTPLAKRKITLDIRDADINDLLRLLSDEINTSIVVSPDVTGKITLSLKSVPLDQALDIIMRMHDLGMRYEGNVIWIAKLEKFQKEEEALLKAAQMREKLEPLEVRLIPVNYALANSLSDNVKSLLTSRGSVNIDERTNTLILKDVAANLDAAEILVNNLDTQTPQILIEARIVETQANFSKEIGIQWGGDGVASAATGNATGIVFPSTVGIAGGSTSENNNGVSSTPNFAVNLPASVGTGAGGALGITLGSLGGTINLNIRLSSLEEKGYLKIVTAPRVMTLDNIQASINSGTSIPISVISAAGVHTVFVEAKLKLEVTPHVTRDGNIYLKINIQKNEPDFGHTGAMGNPSIITKEAHTELLVPDGDTTVIGGIYARNTSQSMSSVPFWGSIPILGYLFRKTTETDNRSELLIFITPKIVNRDESISASGHGSFIPPVERKKETK